MFRTNNDKKKINRNVINRQGKCNGRTAKEILKNGLKKPKKNL